MPRKHTEPIYSKNVAKGRPYAYCYLRGKRISLGAYGSPDSWDRFQRILAAYQQEDPGLANYGTSVPQAATVGELALQYAEHIQRRHAHGSLCKDRMEKSVFAMKVLTRSCLGFAGIPAERFGPKALKSIQEHLIEGRSPRTGKLFARTYINQTIDDIRRGFRWAVSEELVSGNVLERLKAVSGLRAGQARETEARQPVSPALVEATAVHLEADGHPGIAGALRFMRWTGCRPDEVCRLQLGSIEGINSQNPMARLRDHKTRKKTGMDRQIQLGQQALAIVLTAMQSRELELERRLFLSQTGKPLTRGSIYQAVARTCKRHDLERWTPYQLRHLAATEMLESTGSEVVAAAALGHSPNSTIIRRYSRDRMKLARSGAEAIGYREGRTA